MSEGLDVIIIDDDKNLCIVTAETIKRFYVWGDVISFTKFDEAIAYCFSQESSIAIFILDVFLGEQSGFAFLDGIKEKFTSAPQDTIVITGNASEDVVNMCVASDVTYLLEKPVKPYELQLAVRAIVAKYMKFARKVLHDPNFAEVVAKFEPAGLAGGTG
ncbi:MAG: response regulator [Deltaproteobacteria bacterium]|nr:response regulator [Deltaproteobacteria bacterium]